MRSAFLRKGADLSETLHQWRGLDFMFEAESVWGDEDDPDEKTHSLYLIDIATGEKLKVWEATYYG